MHYLTSPFTPCTREGTDLWDVRNARDPMEPLSVLEDGQVPRRLGVNVGYTPLCSKELTVKFL